MEQKLKAIKLFMEAVTDRDIEHQSLSIPFEKYIIYMPDLLNNKRFNIGLRSYLNQVGLQDVNAFIPDNTDSYIILEYQGYRMILKYKDRKMYFYPYADKDEDLDVWKLNKKRCIEFKRLTLSAIAEYLKQIPAIKEKGQTL